MTGTSSHHKQTENFKLNFFGNLRSNFHPTAPVVLGGCPASRHPDAVIHSTVRNRDHILSANASRITGESCKLLATARSTSRQVKLTLVGLLVGTEAGIRYVLKWVPSDDGAEVPNNQSSSPFVHLLLDYCR